MTGVIVTFDPYIGAAFIAARLGQLSSVRYFTSLPFDPDYIDDEVQERLDQLSAFLKRAEAIEADFGPGAILDLENEEITQLIADGVISGEDVRNAKAYRASPKPMTAPQLLEFRA